jgi:hypothetical protein
MVEAAPPAPFIITEAEFLFELCGRDRSQHLGLAAGRGADAAAASIGPRTTTEAASTRCAAPADLGQGARPQPVGRGVQTITWREGAADWLSARFARLRVRPAHRDSLLTELRAQEWLLLEWPEDETEPTKYWFSTLPEDIAFDRLVDATKLRWRIERDYQELIPRAVISVRRLVSLP